jgi:DNA-binding NarL/FixJ family response regulator
MGFEIAVETVRFVLGGGTCVPMNSLFAIDRPASQISEPSVGLTARELAVVRGIRHGKPNKVIAYELNVAESTVKVHMHNVMRKLRAKNRTEVAMRFSAQT